MQANAIIKAPGTRMNLYTKLIDGVACVQTWSKVCLFTFEDRKGRNTY